MWNLKLMTCAKELQGTVELGVLASSRERCRVQIDLDVGRDAFTLDDLLVECERCHRWQIDIDGCLSALSDMTHIVVGVC